MAWSESGRCGTPCTEVVGRTLSTLHCTSILHHQSPPLISANRIDRFSPWSWLLDNCTPCVTVHKDFKTFTRHTQCTAFPTQAHDVQVSNSGAVKMLSSMKDHKSAVNAIAVSPRTGAEAVSASSDGCCIVWDLATMKRRTSFYSNTFFKSVSYHPDESQVRS